MLPQNQFQKLELISDEELALSVLEESIKNSLSESLSYGKADLDSDTFVVKLYTSLPEKTEQETKNKIKPIIPEGEFKLSCGDDPLVLQWLHEAGLSWISGRSLFFYEIKTALIFVRMSYKDDMRAVTCTYCKDLYDSYTDKEVDPYEFDPEWFAEKMRGNNKSPEIKITPKRPPSPFKISNGHHHLVRKWLKKLGFTWNSGKSLTNYELERVTLFECADKKIKFIDSLCFDNLDVPEIDPYEYDSKWFENERIKAEENTD